MYGVLAAGYADWPIISQISWLLGKLMNEIYNVMNGVFGIQNIGICIIIFTIIIYTLMIPLTIKQQKWSKMSSVMNPEIQKVQKKYANKKDQATMLKQQEEMQTIYEKYGTSPTGGCLPLLIQMPVLFALYPVIQNIPNYVEGIKNVYTPVVSQIMATDNFQKIMEKIGTEKPVMMSASSYDYSKADTLVQVLYKFQDSTWNTLVEKIPSLKDAVETTTQTIGHLNSFVGINIGEAPFTMLMSAIKNFSIVGIILAVIIPVMAGLTQFISVKLQPQPQVDTSNPMANSMKTMTYTMPLFSVFMGFTLPAGLGLYWAISAIVRSVQQFAINKYLAKKSTEELIAENQKKAAKKREKKGTSAKTINKMATTSTKSVDDKKKSKMSDAERNERLKKAEQYTKNAKPGSLASKANLVSKYNSGQSTSDKKDES
ncbi:YidC/Oxa1 family membrane protein insertase [Faecalicatena contorta]|uniref:YidC/Oxa1 family membrane protein insertase n=1 Tax=Faecalicatena contorta TaxID=39482 RepID=A0A315ZMN2_9FIRM|nr:YidC/Oxa1 family membrane protein insertase [Faecalicatena contorta]PWJ46831.1 YidC/Oxa1 family membrane protein insertase [Faecalicatena contorta]SUQ16339.1 YidC/Oxa1 family membrane protein insertase [Faecalicatena contorta]